MNNLLPPKLEKGDTIGIVTPASPPYGARQQYLEMGIAYLRQQGFEVLEGKYLHAQRGYLAGTDEERAADLNDMFRNPVVKAIFCVRGGYGTPRLLQLVDYQAIRDNPKILVGYSDITALQLAIYQQTRLVSFSGPMVAVEMGKGISDYTAANFWRILMHTAALDVLPLPPDQELTIHKRGIAEGRLLPGCLSLITPLLGTKFCPNFDNAILVIEDIGEESYRLDRHLAQLKHAGILQKLVGLVFGQFIDCEPKEPDADPYLTVDEVIDDYISDLKVPIVGNFPYGHGDNKLTLPVGTRAILDADSGLLILLDPVVDNRIM